MDYKMLREIKIERRKMFDNACNEIYELINTPDINGANNIHNILRGFNNDPMYIHMIFQTGYGNVIFGKRFKEVEKFLNDDIPFVIVVLDKGRIFTTVSRDEIVW